MKERIHEHDISILYQRAAEFQISSHRNFVDCMKAERIIYKLSKNIELSEEEKQKVEAIISWFSLKDKIRRKARRANEKPL